MNRQKRIAAIHDISGLGKCSLTVALPILSAAGCEAAVIPTAILSTHTGGFKNYTYRDLTDDMLPMAEHWKSNGFKFDAIYSGFLGSSEQIDIVSHIFDMLSDSDTVKIVDPAMADNGSLYATFSDDFPMQMKKLGRKADILTPNITELCMMTDTPYREGPYTRDFIEDLLKKSAEIGCKKIVLTGVYFDEKLLGCATFDVKSGNIDYQMTDKQDGFYHGTGDIFASVLLSALMNDKDLPQAAKIAAETVRECISETIKAGNPIKYGVLFERALPYMMKQLDIIK